MLTSCGAAVSNQPVYNDSAEITDTDTDTVENADFKMTLNRTNYGVTLTKLSTGEVWGTSPTDVDGPQFDELGMPITKHPQVESAIKVTYRNAESRTDDVLLSYTDAVQDGKVSVKRDENGFTVEYRFESAEITVPVRYELLEDSVRISVDPTKITENENRVVKIAVAPFWTAAENDTQNAYLLIPSGSGVLADVSTRSSTGIIYSEQVYGDDGAIEREIISTNSKGVRLPVYGAKSGSTAAFAIIEKGAESAFISADVGASQLGYSAVYAAFQVRGYTNHTAKMFSGSEVKNLLYSAPMITDEVAVRYYPLSGADADYSGMARLYRNYLKKQYDLSEDINENALNLTLIGGKMITKSFLGIPYKTLSPLTTLSEAADIVKELESCIGGNMQLKLAGYNQTGIDVGEVGGGFKLSGKLGSLSDLQKLTEYCKDNGIASYLDYDLVNFNKSGGGFSKSNDAVINVGELAAVQYDYDVASKSKLEDSVYYLLSPMAFTEAWKKLLHTTEKLSVDGISLSSLSNTSYSDYADKTKADYYSKSGMTEAAQDVFKAVASSGKKLLGTDANLYAAMLSDSVVEIPNGSSDDYSFTYDIPFYAMVMKGLVPIYGESVNTTPDATLALLHAIEGGTGLGYTVVNSWNNSLINSHNMSFYNCAFSDLKEEIAENSLIIADYLKKLNGSEIKSHTVLSSGLRETVFENGVAAYVNYSDTAIKTPHGEVAAHNYLVLEKLS